VQKVFLSLIYHLPPFPSFCSFLCFAFAGGTREWRKERKKKKPTGVTVRVAKLAIACASLFGVVSFGPSFGLRDAHEELDLSRSERTGTPLSFWRRRLCHSRERRRNSHGERRGREREEIDEERAPALLPSLSLFPLLPPFANCRER
jgi:hypothetical protein